MKLNPKKIQTLQTDIPVAKLVDTLLGKGYNVVVSDDAEDSCITGFQHAI